MSTVTTVGTCDFVWDFSVDGGAIGAIDLSAKANRAPIPDKALVTKVHAIVLDAVTSDGSATLEWGNTSDADGYSGAALAHTEFTANKVFNGQGNGDNCLWDNTSKNEKSCYLITANDRDFKLTIGGAALTGGKIQFLIELVHPGSLSR